MKRDMDLARQILLRIEEAPPGEAEDAANIDGVDPTVAGYHVMLLAEAGLIEAISASSFGNQYHWIPTRLTWQGHDFVENARNETIWRRAKATVASKGGSVAFDVLKAILVQAAKDTFLPSRSP